MDLKTFDYKRAVTVLLFFALVFALGYFFAGELLFTLLPFLFAWGLAFPVRRVATVFHKRTGIPYTPLAVLTVLVFLLGVVVLLVSLGTYLVFEAEKLLRYLSENKNFLSDAYEGLRLSIARIFGGAFENGEWSETLDGALTGLLESLAGLLAGALGKAITALPQLVFSLVVFVVSSIYFAIDLTAINAFVRKRLPPLWQGRLTLLKNGAARAFLCYLRSYFVIFLVNASGLYLGFRVLSRSYALLFSLLIALLDLLPVIGIGTALVPWGLYLLFTGDAFAGGGLLLLYAVLTLLRQLLEARLIGKGVGLHPLATLFSSVVGFSWFGFFGVFLGPVVSVFIKSLSKSEKE